MIFQRESLLKIVSPTASSVGNSTIPILENIVFSGSENIISCYSYNSLYSVRAEAEHQVADDFTFCIPAKKFLGILKALPKDCDVSVEKDGDSLIVKHKRSRFVLHLSDIKEYPMDNEGADNGYWDIPLSAIDFASVAMAKNDVRKNLNGLLVRPLDKETDFVATNGHRLSRQTADSGVAIFGGNDALIPAESVRAIIRIFGHSGLVSVGMVESGNRKKLSVASHLNDYPIVLTTSLIDAEYVNYDRVIPNNPHEVALDPKTLLAAIEMVYGLRESGSTGTETVVIKIDGTNMSFEHKTPSGEKATTEIEIEESSPVELALNVHYALDALSSLKDEEEIVLSYDGSERAVKIESNNKTCVIMPIRM